MTFMLAPQALECAHPCVQVMDDVCALTHTDEIVAKLDRMHLAYKNLRKWFEEGVVMTQVLDPDLNCTSQQFVHQL
jgi:hypothetical protein